MDVAPDIDDPDVTHHDEDDDPGSLIGDEVEYDLGPDDDPGTGPGEDPGGEDPDDGEEPPPGMRPPVRLAPVLVCLRNEINARWPNRDRASDGWIGDTAHQATKSDHNPDHDNSVNALDVDRDGIDPQLVVRRAIVHPSTQYVIFDRTIWSRTRGFTPSRYTGSNPHTKHLHVSVSHSPELENSRRAWGIDAGVPTKPLKLGDRVLRTGCTGADVRELQALANTLGAKPPLTVDGDFGSRTEAWVSGFQKAKKLTVDGLVGPKTVAALRTASTPTPAKPSTTAKPPTPAKPQTKPPAKPPTKPPAQPRREPGSRTLRRSATGDDVGFVQRFIGERRCGTADGEFGTRTEAGVRWYQKMQGLTADGAVGPRTWRKMGVQVRY
ncbi:peptidoglycan-binding protein [Micromonospora sp. NPDC047527]|uniref:peptidoglycan-binding domain-containing protein n=1 Tax=Micromonospora sp. NPDC047527 TaxID=3155144 RepID=UPI0033DCBBF1